MTMRITASLIKEVLPTDVYDRLSPSDIFAVEMAIVKHLLRLTDYRAYGTELKHILSTTVRKQLRSHALTDFKVIVKLKFALLAVLRENTLDRDDHKRIFKKHGISNHSRLVRELGKTKLYAKAVKAAQTVKWQLFSEKDVVQACDKLIVSIETFMRKFAYRKLRFLPNSNNLELKDIVSDLREKAVQAFYSITPFLTPEHTLNSIKRAVHNKGINLIKFYGANKRKRLHNNGDGTFSNTIISVSLTGKDGEDAGENPAIYKNVIDNRYVDLETRISIDSIMNTHGKQPLKGRVIQLLSMKPDPEFTKFVTIHYKGIKKDYTTEEIFPALGRENFLAAVRQYVGANEPTFNSFIRALQSAM